MAKPWTQDADQIVRATDNAKSVRKAAKFLSRSVAAIYSRRWRLNGKSAKPVQSPTKVVKVAETPPARVSNATNDIDRLLDVFAGILTRLADRVADTVVARLLPVVPDEKSVVQTATAKRYEKKPIFNPAGKIVGYGDVLVQ